MADVVLMKFRCWNGHAPRQHSLPAAGASQQVLLAPHLSVVQVAAWQVPAEQTCPARQAFAHVPQLAGSVWRFTQVSPQSVRPLVQVRRQLPATQFSPEAQAVVQVPQ
jgi:hypothetical protein